jgi:hypothetical protein
MKRWILTAICSASLFWGIANAAPKKPESTEKKKMNFEETLVEGQVYRPELSVVTGDTALGGLGLLRLRADFKDHEQSEKEEAIP